MNLQEIRDGFKYESGRYVFDGDIEIHDPNLKSLEGVIPQNATIKGTLDLEGTAITSLPKGLKCGSLFLEDTNITELPSDLEFKGDLDLQRSSIERLPDNLVVQDELDLRGCKNIKTLPKGLVVGLYLLLEGSGITNLPDDLIIEYGRAVWKEDNDS